MAKQDDPRLLTPEEEHSLRNEWYKLPINERISWRDYWLSAQLAKADEHKPDSKLREEIAKRIESLGYDKYGCADQILALIDTEQHRINTEWAELVIQAGKGGKMSDPDDIERIKKEAKREERRIKGICPHKKNTP